MTELSIEDGVLVEVHICGCIIRVWPDGSFEDSACPLHLPDPRDAHA